jgi:hypothetical protein
MPTHRPSSVRESLPLSVKSSLESIRDSYVNGFVNTTYLDILQLLTAKIAQATDQSGLSGYSACWVAVITIRRDPHAIHAVSV